MHQLQNSKPIAIWLFACCLFIALMIFIGGVTRLTGSGLSMTNWQPFTGFLPPFNQNDWQALFNDYRLTPEYKLINKGMSLEGFKNIFWLEFIHRVMGRITGFVFLIPFLYFALTKKLNKNLCLKLGSIFLLGASQALIGWLMVSSGLKDKPNVSQYWLAFHLTTAFIIFALVYLLALSIYPNKDNNFNYPKLMPTFTYALTFVILVQVVLGGFVAGLDAGLIYNSFPDMNGYFVPPDIFFMKPVYLNFTENPTTVQFIHRMGAYLVSLLIIVYFIKYRKFKFTNQIKYAIYMLIIATIMQVKLGVLTLLHQVPISLASAHQMGALLMFTISLYLSFKIKQEKV